MNEKTTEIPTFLTKPKKKSTAKPKAKIVTLGENLNQRVKKSSTIWVVIIAVLIYVDIRVEHWLTPLPKSGVADMTLITQAFTFLTTVLGLYITKEGVRIGFGSKK